jgi:hypothetical protein
MIIYSVYDLATGAMTGARVMASTPELLPDAVPEGCGLVLGDWDHVTNVVDLITGIVSVIAAPSPDWRARKAELASAAYTAILSAESEQSRPMREVIAALLAGSAPDPVASERFASIGTQIAAARARYTAVLATQSADDLAALLAAPA